MILAVRAASFQFYRLLPREGIENKSLARRMSALALRSCWSPSRARLAGWSLLRRCDRSDRDTELRGDLSDSYRLPRVGEMREKDLLGTPPAGIQETNEREKDYLIYTVADRPDSRKAS